MLFPDGKGNGLPKDGGWLVWQVGSRHGPASIAWVPGSHVAATLSADGQLQTWDLQVSCS